MSYAVDDTVLIVLLHYDLAGSLVTGLAGTFAGKLPSRILDRNRYTASRTGSFFPVVGERSFQRCRPDDLSGSILFGNGLCSAFRLCGPRGDRVLCQGDFEHPAIRLRDDFGRNDLRLLSVHRQRNRKDQKTGGESGKQLFHSVMTSSVIVTSVSVMLPSLTMSSASRKEMQ